MDVLDGDDEKYRLISFISIVAEIQRGFILQCGLFLRGGIVIGDISFNNDYVLGQGLVDAVDSEEKAVYPRIIVSRKLVEFLSQNTSYTKEEAEKAISLEEKVKNGEYVNEEDIYFYQRMLSLANKEHTCLKISQNLLPCWNDGEVFVSYLYHFSARDFLDRDTIKSILNNIYDTKLSESNKNELSKLIFEDNTENVLNEHKKQVINELKKYGKYTNLSIDEIKLAELREKILKKYVWVMAYHNDMCNKYQSVNNKIATLCNCDRRFMKMTIEVLDDENRI
jgi:membrane-associated HD superfamily phosphohydrolase